ncbi:hypothetical protein QBZ16_003862 [Prototheca wickerhamii]|uniref:Mitochondrial import inner membrane translocase subunit n=1 Tax=Prototheca wickerhamii TaxID=3111 RepID=A0AAD9IIY9_PROWI|nr:hypothetical protein QBZ16_003862 [Prototheca wickerhamii]
MSSFGSSGNDAIDEGQVMSAEERLHSVDSTSMRPGRHLQIKQEMAVAFIQEFYQTVRDKCFAACVTKPSSSLGSSEQQCLARCCDRYTEATQIVTKATLEMSGLAA